MPERIVGFRSLLMTDRAVRRKGCLLRVHLAGRVDLHPPFVVEFFFADDAKRAAGSLLVHIREKIARSQVATDAAYNAVIMDWVAQLAELGYIKKKAESNGDRTADVIGDR